MQNKNSIFKFCTKILFFFVIFNYNSISKSEIIIFTGCKNEHDGFKKNEYILDLEKSTMIRNFIYDNKTYKKYRLSDIKTKKKNSITRFIYKENDKILTDKIGYPQFYTQLLFEKENLIIKIKTVVNDEIGISELSKCSEIEKFDNKS